MPKDPLEKLVDRPKRRPLYKPRTAKWIVMEPNRIGVAGGWISATLALVFYFVRHLEGHDMPPGRVLVGAAATFVVGYGAFGIFTWYLLWVAERELPIPDDEYRIGIKGRSGMLGSGNAPDPTNPSEPPTPVDTGEES